MEEDFRSGLEAMMETLRRHGIKDKKVLGAMRAVKRHNFIPESYRSRFDPYGDYPGPIGCEQTISQPFIVAYMTEMLQLKPGEKVLEVGTGSGYQAAVLAEMGADVVSIEVRPQLAETARAVLGREGYGQVKVVTGDGYDGVPEMAPFDAILVSCAPPEVPEKLAAQLRDGGRMAAPVGRMSQQLILVTRQGKELLKKESMPVVFVPMIHGWKTGEDDRS